MNPLFVLAGIGAAVWGGLIARRKLPEGQRPFDNFPPGVSADSRIGVEVFEASSKRRYTVTSFAAADGRKYYVAEKKGDVDWISWLLSPAGVRTIWGASADKTDDVAGMQLDFDISGTVHT